MVGYLEHGDCSIRMRSGGCDVPLGSAPYLQFVQFDELRTAKKFIDSGRNAAGMVIYNMQTQDVEPNQNKEIS